MAGVWELGIPTFGRGDGRGGLAGGGNLCHPPTEHSCTVHRGYTQDGYLSGSGASPWGTDVPVGMIPGEFGPGGDVGGGKCGIDDRDGGIWRRARIIWRD